MSYYYLLLPAILFTFYAQFKVKNAYSRYSQVENSRRITGYEAARRFIVDKNLNVGIAETSGTLTDNYNPQTGMLNLSGGVYASDSVAAVAIAAHECGHACQHAEGYGLLAFRNSLVPVANIGNNLAWPILFVGLLIGSGTGDMIFNIGVLMFLAVVLFHLVTLPVELDASRRGLQMLEECGIIDHGTSEYSGARSVLSAAALTYVAALAMAVANLLRILALRGNRRR